MLCGFTLVELLVVVAIIAVLLGIMLPSLGKARDAARKVVCTSNHKQIVTAIWAYITEHRQRVPYVESPMHNNAFGNATLSDEQVDPFDPVLWPMSLPNMLEGHLGGSMGVFGCPAALVGWPREAERFAMSFRPASANQPNGVVDAAGGYFRESFGFLDGRKFEQVEAQPSNHPIQQAINLAIARSVYLRDMVQAADDGVRGPHDGGINVINRNLEVESRDQTEASADLAPNGSPVKF